MKKAALALVLTASAACGSATTLTNVWTEPSVAPDGLRKLMVINVAKTAAVRRGFEDRFAAALRAFGVEVVPSYDLVRDAALDSVQATDAMHKAHCDGVLVTRVLDQRTVRSYYPASYFPPAAYYAGWYRYYSFGYSHLAGPPILSRTSWSTWRPISTALAMASWCGRRSPGHGFSRGRRRERQPSQ